MIIVLRQVRLIDETRLHDMHVDVSLHESSISSFSVEDVCIRFVYQLVFLYAGERLLLLYLAQITDLIAYVGVMEPVGQVSALRC